MKKFAVLALVFLALAACTKKTVATTDSEAPTKEDEAVADGASNPASAPDETQEKSEKSDDKAADGAESQE